MSSELEKLQAENFRLKKTVEDLWTINHLARIISSTMPVDQILDAVVKASLRAVDAEQGTISLLNEKKDDQTEAESDAAFKTLIRRVDTSTPRAQFRLDEKLSDWMLQNRKPLIINDVTSDKTVKGLSLASQEIRSILSVPLVCKGELIGVVNIFNKKNGLEFSKDDQRLLAIIATQSAQTIENARLYQEEKQLRRYEHELELARRIQHDLIPKTEPEFGALEIASFFKPAHKVGGDYFDYFKLAEDQIGIVMADVSGHGPSAALVMTMVKGIIHAVAPECESPSSLLARLNRILNAIGPSGMFVTMVFLVFDLSKKTLRFSNAGHNPLLYCQRSSRLCASLELAGAALCVTDLAKYSIKEIVLQPGDLIILYTDGVTEAFNEHGQMFEEGRLTQVIETANRESAKQVVEQVMQSLSEFTANASQSDDIAMIVVKVT